MLALLTAASLRSRSPRSFPLPFVLTVVSAVHPALRGRSSYARYSGGKTGAERGDSADVGVEADPGAAD